MTQTCHAKKNFKIIFQKKSDIFYSRISPLLLGLQNLLVRQNIPSDESKSTNILNSRICISEILKVDNEKRINLKLKLIVKLKIKDEIKQIILETAAEMNLISKKLVKKLNLMNQIETKKI